MPSHPFADARYLKSVHHLRDLPPAGGREVAIAGRSNAGKSSAINAIAGQKSLARTSKTPGRTQQLVYFELGDDRFLVDLPGYGYAKVPEALRAHWQGLIDRFFREREALVGLVVVMDCRHPLRDYDRQMLAYSAARGLPALALLTKADKLPRGQQAKALREVRAGLSREFGDSVEVQLLSAVTGQGVEEARTRLAALLDPPATAGPAAPAGSP